MSIQKIEYQERAWDYFLMQFKNSPILEAFIKSLVSDLNDQQTALVDLLEKRTLENSKGAQLDGIGEIVGIKRPHVESSSISAFGFQEQPYALTFEKGMFVDEAEAKIVYTALNDEDYRRLIYYKITINNGHGTAQEIAKAISFIFNTNNVIIKETGNAKLTIAYSSESIPEFIEKNAIAYIPKLAGVGVLLLPNLKEKFFGFRGQLGSAGFGKGILKTTRNT